MALYTYGKKGLRFHFEQFIFLNCKVNGLRHLAKLHIFAFGKEVVRTVTKCRLQYMHITALYTYPIKSLGISLPKPVSKSEGYSLDRHWMLVDRDGLFISQGRFPSWPPGAGPYRA